MGSHRDRILDQFTRQAAPFADAPAIRDREALDRIVRMAGAGPSDTVLDVACGPGLLVCAFATVARHAHGIDVTPAMLERARAEQRAQGLANVSWVRGDVQSLPFADESCSIVSARFTLHHLPDPLAVLREMRRVCNTGGRVVVADSAPAPDKAEAFNAMERLRDPSHVRAMSLAELSSLLGAASLHVTGTAEYRLGGELEDLLRRSFPNPSDVPRIREMFRECLSTDSLDMAVRQVDGKLHYAFPVAILAARKI